jgi:hypothetical protein
MNVYKHLKVAAISVLSLGVIHICATPAVAPMLNALPLLSRLAMLYMFVATGLLFVFVGWLQLFCLNHLSNYAPVAIAIRMSIILVAGCAIAAVAIMYDNPFAYLTLLVALYEVWLLTQMIDKVDTNEGSH